MENRDEELSVDEIIKQVGIANQGSAFSMDQHINNDGSVLVQGDIKMTPDQAMGTLRKALGYNWTRGVVPYVISSAFNARDKQRIQAAMNEWMQKTCVRFRPATRND